MMFVSYMLFALAMLCSAIKAENLDFSTIKVPPGERILIIAPQNTTLNQPNTNISVNSQNSAESNAKSAAMNETISQIKLNVENKIKSLKEYAEQQLPYLKGWGIKNKWRIAGGCIAALYIYMWYKLLWLSYALSDANAWHNYKAKVSFDELLQLQHEELANDLVKKVQQRYAPDALEDFFTPFTLFTKDIDKEMEYLEELITLYKRLGLIRISWLFPWKKITQEEAQEKLRRILYLRNTAFAWLGSFKLNRYLQLPPEYLFVKRSWF